MKSVPPRGSGWVSLRIYAGDESLLVGATRYRVVVLTSSPPRQIGVVGLICG